MMHVMSIQNELTRDLPNVDMNKHAISATTRVSRNRHSA